MIKMNFVKHANNKSFRPIRHRGPGTAIMLVFIRVFFFVYISSNAFSLTEHTRCICNCIDEKIKMKNNFLTAVYLSTINGCCEIVHFYLKLQTIIFVSSFLSFLIIPKLCFLLTSRIAKVLILLFVFFFHRNLQKRSENKFI